MNKSYKSNHIDLKTEEKDPDNDYVPLSRFFQEEEKEETETEEERQEAIRHTWLNSLPSQLTYGRR